MLSAGLTMSGSRSVSGIGTGIVGSDHDTVASSRAKRTFITLPDQGLLHRFTGERFTLSSRRTCICEQDCSLDIYFVDPNLPHNTAPATETSLRSAMAKEALEQAQQMQGALDL